MIKHEAAKKMEIGLIKRKIFVGGLAKMVNEEDLYNYFSTFGEIEKVILNREHYTNKSRCCGFILFRDEGSARDVLSYRKGHFLMGKYFGCKPCKLRSDIEVNGYYGLEGPGETTPPVSETPKEAPRDPNNKFTAQELYQAHFPNLKVTKKTKTPSTPEEPKKEEEKKKVDLEEQERLQKELIARRKEKKLAAKMKKKALEYDPIYNSNYDDVGYVKKKAKTGKEGDKSINHVQTGSVVDYDEKPDLSSQPWRKNQIKVEPKRGKKLRKNQKNRSSRQPRSHPDDPVQPRLKRRGIIQSQMDPESSFNNRNRSSYRDFDYSNAFHSNSSYRNSRDGSNYRGYGDNNNDYYREDYNRDFYNDGYRGGQSGYHNRDDRNGGIRGQDVSSLDKFRTSIKESVSYFMSKIKYKFRATPYQLTDQEFSMLLLSENWSLPILLSQEVDFSEEFGMGFDHVEEACYQPYWERPQAGNFQGPGQFNNYGQYGASEGYSRGQGYPRDVNYINNHNQWKKKQENDDDDDIADWWAEVEEKNENQFVENDRKPRRTNCNVEKTELIIPQNRENLHLNLEVG